MDFWTEYYKNQEEERKRLLGLSTTPKRKTADELLAESLKPTLNTDWTPYTQGKSPMYPGAPEGAWLPTTLADAFNDVVKTSEFPDETEARLNSAYLLSQTYNIPIETAIRDFEPITSALYKKTLAPQTAFQAIKTTWQAAQIGTRIADISNQLWNKGKDWDFEKDPLWQEMMQLQAMMPVQDEIKRSLPVEALKSMMEFLPSQMESMKAGALGGLAGAGAGALIAGMLVPGMQIPLIGITALGGLSMLTAQASVIGLGRTMGTMAQTAERSRQLETGSAFYSFLSYQDPMTGAKLNPQIAWEWAGMYGSLAGAVETIGVETFLSKLTPDIGKSAANLLKKRATDILTDPKQQVSRAGIVQRHFLGWAGDAVKYAWEHGGDIIAETTEEALQEALQILSQETAKRLTEDTDSVQFTYMTRQQVASQIAETAWGAFLGTSAMAGIRGGVKLFTATPGATTKLSSEIQSTKNATREEALSSQTYEVFKQQINQPLPKGLTFGRTEQVAGERYTYKIGDSKKKRLESATVDIAPSQNENEPGTVNIIGFEKESDPKIAQALVTKIAQTFPGWRIDISEQTPFSQALTRYMSERNPKGQNLGINPYPTYRAIPEQASMNAVEEAIRSVKPTWTEEELRLSTRWLTGLAPQIGMTPDELAKKTFHPVVAVGFSPDDPSKTFGAASQVEYEKGIKSLISLGPKANASTVLHETVHTTLWYLQANRNIPQVAMFLDEAERVFKIKNRDWRADWEGWTAEYEKTAGANPNRSGEEALAYALEDYLAFGKVQEDQESVLAKLAKMVVELYNGLKAARVTLTPEVTAFFDKIMTDSPVAQEMQLETETEAIGIATEPLGTTQEPEVEKNYQEPPEDAPAVQQQQQEKDSTGANNELEIFQGQRDKTFAQNTLSIQEAKKMAQEGRSPEEIKGKTGWTQVRGQWMHDPLFQGQRERYETDEFKAWFKNSKVVDENGTPLVVYRGIPKSANSMLPSSPNGFTWFTTDQEDAKDYESGQVVETYLSAKNIADLDSKNIKSIIGKTGVDPDDLFDISQNGELVRATLIEAGYDGVFVSRPDVSEGVTHYAVFSPTQIKSVNNRGTWDQNDPRILYQGRREERILNGEEYETKGPVWLSRAEEVIDQKIKGPQPGRQILNTLRNAGVKQEEIKWTDLETFLDTDEKRTPQEVKDYLAANQLGIHEVVKSDSSRSFTKFSQHTLPGGANYRELLFTLPVNIKQTYEQWKAENGWAYEGYSEEKLKQQYEIVKKDQEAGNSPSNEVYYSQHWNEPNVLAHTRLNDRTTTDGKMLFIEEIQSDWHQKGRKNGYIEPLSPVEENRKYDLMNIPTADRTMEQNQELERYFRRTYMKVPAAPFSKTWHEFVFKRILRMAVDDGYDAIGWTTGDQQNERYSLAKYIETIGYIKRGEDSYRLVVWDKEGGQVYRSDDVSPTAMEEIVGKELTQKIVNGEGEKASDVISGLTYLQGLDLEVGGEGMRGFYDKMLVDFGNKYGKKWDTQVQDAKIHTIIASDGLLLHEYKNAYGDLFTVDYVNNNGGMTEIASFPSREMAEKFIADQYEIRKTKGTIIHSLPITEAMVESIGQGQYLFQGFGGPSTEGGYNAGAAIQELLKNKAGIVERAAYVEGIGDIAFPWGWEGTEEKNYENGYGLAKIMKKHEESDNILAEIGEVLRLGRVSDDPYRGNRKWVVYKNIKAVIALDRNGEPGAWLVTAYIPETWRNKNSPSAGLTSIGAQNQRAQETGPQVPTDSPTVPRKRMVVKVVRRPNNPDDLKKLYQGIAVKHGSGAGFSKFNLAFVGTGEGAQAYGYGLYFTENPKIAKEHYADRLGTNAGLRTTFGDMSPDDMSQMVETWAVIVDDETDDGPMVEFADFLQTRTGQNAAEAAMSEFMQELKRRLTALGDKALFMNSDRLEELANVAMTGTDDPDDAADLEKLDKYQAIIKNEIRETKNTLRPKFEYEASFDEKKEYFPDILDMIVDTALDADMVTTYGGRFIYDAELELRGDNPGGIKNTGNITYEIFKDMLGKAEEIDLWNKGRDYFNKYGFTRDIIDSSMYGQSVKFALFAAVNGLDKDNKKPIRTPEEVAERLGRKIFRAARTADNWPEMKKAGWGGSFYAKGAAALLLEDLGVVFDGSNEKKFDYDAPLRNTLIRWEKPLYDDQIAALYRYFEKQKKEATDVGLEEMAEEWERISSILVHMEEGDNTGKGLYNYLTNEFDSWGWTSRNNEEYDEGEGEKITSDLLYQAGFDGIQYPVAYLSGVRGDKGWNYVMFDDSAITITKRTLYQGEAQNPDPINQMAIEMIGEGQSFDDFVSFLESGLVDDSWGIPDIEPGAKKEWYRKKWDEALTPEAAAPAVATWVKSLAQDEYKGIRGMLQIIWDEVIQKENEKPYPGADPEEILELQAQQERAYQIRQDIAESIVAGALAVGSKDKPLSKHFMASLYGTIKENPGSYARIYGELTGNETLMAAGQTEEAAQFAEIEDPSIASTMTISQKKANADQISNEKIAKAVRSGEYNDDPEIVKYVKALQKENAESKKQLEILNKEIKEADVTIDYQAKAIGKLRGDSRKTNREIDAIQKRISDYLDAGITIPPALESRRKSLTAKRDKIRQDLVAAADWVEINRQIEESKRKILNAEREMASANEKGETNWDAVNTRSTEQENIRKLEARVAEGKSFRDSAAVQTYLAKLEERAALEEKYAKKEGEQKALRIIREHRAKLLKQIKRPAAKNANVKYKSAITSIQKILNLKYPADQIDSARSVAMALIGKIAAEPSLADLAPSADLEKIIGKTPAKISTADLERIYSIIMALRKTGREVQSAIDERIAQENSLRRGRIGDVLESLPGYKRPTGTDTTVNENKTIINRIRQLDYAFKNAYRQLRDMDGGVDGENVEFAWTRMNRLWREKEINANRRKNAILSAIRDLGGDPKDWYDEVITVPGAGKENGNAVLRKTDLMAMALAFRNEDSRQAILYGKFFSEGEKREWKKLALQNKELAWGVAEAEGERKFYLLNEAINDALSEHDWTIINTVFEKDGVETAPRLTQKVAEATGEEMVVVDHYFPILRKGVGEQQLAQQQADEVNMRTRGLRRPPANGFTKARIKISPWHQRDVDTDLLGLWLKSIDRQEQYISFVMYGKELDAVYQDQLVQEQIKGKFGMAGVEFIQDYINEVKNPSEYSKGTAADTAIKFMRGNLGAAYLGFRVASVLKQVITSPWPALPYAGPRLFTEAVKMMGNPVKYLRVTEELSIFLQSRSFDVIQATVKNADVQSKLGKRIKNAELLGMKGMEYADRFSVAIGWRAVFEKALEETGDTQKAIEKADQMVMQTQPTGRGVDLAPAYRGKSAAVQIVLQFTQALNVVYQQLRFDIPAAIRAHDLKTALGIATGAMIAGTLLQAMTSRPPEEPEDPKKAAARWIFYALSQGTDSLPLIGEQATRIMKRAITGETSYKMVDEAMPAIAEFLDGMYSLAGQDWQKGLDTMAQSFGSFAGMPVSGIKGAGRVLSGDFGTLIGRPRKER